jgi:DNA-binding NtrC family response regulator
MATRVLVDDDEAAIRTSLRRILERSSFEVTEAPDGQTALRHFAGNPTDCVISDIYMPGMDGIEFLIRVQEAFPDVRVIAMSGGGYQPKENVLGAASMLGAVTVLEKPLEVAEVLAAVHLALESDGPG